MPRGGELLACAGEDGGVEIWDLRGGKPRLFPGGRLRPEGGRARLTFSPDGGILVSTGNTEDAPLRFWDLRRGRVRAFGTLEGYIRDLNFSTDGKSLGMTVRPEPGGGDLYGRGTGDVWLRRWTLEGDRLKQQAQTRVPCPKSARNRADWSPDLRHVAIEEVDDDELGRRSGRTRLLRWRGGEYRETAVLEGYANRSPWSPTGRFLVLRKQQADPSGIPWGLFQRGKTCEWLLWDVANHEEGRARFLAFPASGSSDFLWLPGASTQFAVTIPSEGRLLLLDAASGTKLQEWQFPEPLEVLMVDSSDIDDERQFLAADRRHLLLRGGGWRTRTHWYLLRLWGGEEEELLASCEAVLRRDPRDIPALLQRGQARLKRGQPNEALADATLALRLAPASKEAHRLRGLAYTGLKKPAQAVAAYHALLRLDPGDAWAWYQRGLGHADLGDLGKARRDIAQALKLDPSLASAAAGK